jgi:hypothetical protein
MRFLTVPGLLLASRCGHLGFHDRVSVVADPGGPGRALGSGGLL